MMTKSYARGWQSVIHLTTGNYVDGYGDRIPAVYIKDNNMLEITSAVNGEGNYVYNGNPPPVNIWMKISIRQKQTNAKYMYEIWIDDTLVKSVENKKPSDFKNVKVYAANPFPSLHGMIRKLTINNKPLCDNVMKGLIKHL